MKGHLSGDEIGRYLSRTLSPGDVLALHEHTESCPDCRKALGEATLARLPCVDVPLFADRVAPHLTEEEMVAFVSGRMPEALRAQASRHLAACDPCLDSVGAMESERDRAVRAPRSSGLPWLSPSRLATIGVLAAALIVVAIYVGHRHPNPPAQAPMLASLRDGSGAIELDAQGSLHGLEAAPADERDAVRDTLQRGSLPAGPAMPAEAPGVLLGPGSAAPAFSLVGPLHTRVLSDKPEFTWQPYPGAERYQVVVTNENLDPVARSGMLTATQWQPDTALPRGVVFLWQVRAWKGSDMVSAPAPPAQPARFEIAPEAVAARIEQLRASPRPSHLLAAVLSAQAGLNDEAAKELQALAQENPGSKIVAKLQTGR
jgi:Putative zinc-finger